jgi:hypothetical protein
VSPVPRSRRYYEGATTSRSRIRGRLLIRCHSPHDPPVVRVSPQRLLQRLEASSRPGPLVVPVSPNLRLLRVDANGISQVFRRSIPCLCSVPGPRSNRRDLASDGHLDAALVTRTTKASAILHFGANPQLRHLLPYASRVALPHTCKACFRLAGCASTGRELNPLDRYERFQFVLTIILLSCSPDATGYRFRSSGLLANPSYGLACLGHRRPRRPSNALPAVRMVQARTRPGDRNGGSACSTPEGLAVLELLPRHKRFFVRGNKGDVP